MSAKSAASSLQFSKFLWISFGLHLLIFVVGALSNAGIFGQRKKMIDLDAPVIWTDLSLGKAGAGGATSIVQKNPAAEIKKSEPVATPQVIKPVKSPEKTPSEVVKTTVKETPKKAPVVPKTEVPQEDPVQKAAEQRRLAMQSALSNVKQDVQTAPKSEQVGGGDSAKSGVGGTTQAQLFRMQIKRRIEDNIHVTDYDWFGKYREREVEYLVRVDQGGNIIEAKLRKSSGVASMDQHVLQAIRISEPFAAPTDELRQFYAREGISVRFSPKNLER